MIYILPNMRPPLLPANRNYTQYTSIKISSTMMSHKKPFSVFRINNCSLIRFFIYQLALRMHQQQFFIRTINAL